MRILLVDHGKGVKVEDLRQKLHALGVLVSKIEFCSPNVEEILSELDKKTSEPFGQHEVVVINILDAAIIEAIVVAIKAHTVRQEILVVGKYAYESVYWVRGAHTIGELPEMISRLQVCEKARRDALGR